MAACALDAARWVTGVHAPKAEVHFLKNPKAVTKFIADVESQLGAKRVESGL